MAAKVGLRTDATANGPQHACKHRGGTPPLITTLSPGVVCIAAKHTMHPASPRFAQWSTASFGHSSETSPLDLASLQAHIVSCSHGRSHALRWRLAAQDAHRFVCGRVISSLMVLGIALTLIAYVW